MDRSFLRDGGGGGGGGRRKKMALKGGTIFNIRKQFQSKKENS